MKKSIIIFCLLMMVGFLGTSYSQDAVQEKPVLTAEQQQAVDAAISMDPKLSAEEIEQMKIAVLGAPAKAELASDPKEETQSEVVAAPWNAEPIEEREEVLPQTTDPTSLTTIPTNMQADPGKAENVVKLQSHKVPGATQQAAPKSDKVVSLHSYKKPGATQQAAPDGK